MAARRTTTVLAAIVFAICIVASTGVASSADAAERPTFGADQTPTPAKIAPDLSAAIAAATPAAWTIVAPGHDPIVAVIATISPGTSLADATKIAFTHHAALRSESRVLHALTLELPFSEIGPLANETAVRWIETPLPRLTSTNLENRSRVGANEAQAVPNELDGAGVNLLIYDSGAVLISHPDLSDHLTILDDSAALSHSTHVAGTAGGSGAASFGMQRGMAPGVHLLSAGIIFSGTSSVILYSDPGDLESDFDTALSHSQYPCDIANMSLGSNVEVNFYPCAIQGDYGASDRLLDGIVRGSLGRPLVVVIAGGNERQSSRCDVEGFGDFYSIAPPAGSKNPLSIGAVNSDDDSMTMFSSWGPTDDGRLKPDFVGPGCQTDGDGGVTSCAVFSTYEVRCGTSMAAPTVAGMCAILFEEYRRLHPFAAAPRAAAYKALFANTAVDLGQAGPDYRFGFGSVRLLPALAALREHRLAEGSVSAGVPWSARAIVPVGAAELKLTLAWDDLPAPPGASAQLVNDLDLIVTGPDGVRRYPWTLNPQLPDAPAVRTQADHRNNIEQVALSNPPPGEYTIEVAPFAADGTQTFALASATPLARCTHHGAFTVDPAARSCAGEIEIELADCDGNLNAATPDAIVVHASSTTNAVGQDVMLHETAAASGTFSGALSLSSDGTPGTFRVSDGDLVTLEYIDADDGVGGTNIAVREAIAIDCAPPTISNVRISSVMTNGAAIEFDTSELAAASVSYGTSCIPTDTNSAPGRHTHHRVFLPNLAANTVYQFRPSAVDGAGNSATLSDAGGACFSLRTAAATDYFTEIFQQDDNDLNSKSVLLTPIGANNYYDACRKSISALPTDPTGGQVLALSDDGSAMISPAGGSLLLYGIAYDAVWVNANGTLTFDGPDADYRELTFTHFARPAIAPLWDNFNPAAEGVLSWKELPDRIAVTWDDVVDAGLSSNSTFQAEMFFDGRIRLSWLESGILDGLAGISRGGGRPADYRESDMSGYAICGVQPPAASEIRKTVPTRTAARIRLAASATSGAPLQYVIRSAPAGELRDPATGQTITAANVPYALTGGGNEVLYYSRTPQALDSFQYRATDGGAPPTGGDSNIATVTLIAHTPLRPPIYDSFDTADFDAGIWDTVNGATIDAQGIATPTPPLAARLNGDPRSGDVLTTQMIDLRAMSAAFVEYAYERRGGGESPDPGDDLIVSYLAADGRWMELSRQLGHGPDMTQFATAGISLPADALHSGFRLRIQCNANETGAVDDWFVDDLRITATPLGGGRGDVTCDAALTNFDVDPFVLALVDPMGYAIAFPFCDARRADFDGDGELTNFDVDAFVTCLVNLGCP